MRNEVMRGRDARDPNTKPEGNLKPALRKWGPWLVTAAVFWYVFNKVSLIEVADAAVHVDLKIFIPLLVINVTFHFFWDALVYTLLFRWFGVKLTYWGMAPVRGASYLLMLLNFFVGQGGLAVLMNRWKGLSISRASSIMLFTIFHDYYLIVGLCLIGAFRLPDVDLVCLFRAGDEGDLVRFIIISWLAFALHIGFYRLLLPRSPGFARIKDNEVLSSFREAPLWLYVKLWGIKGCNSVVSILTAYFVLPAFGVHVPLLHLSVMLPIVWLIGSVPITVMGLGTIQAGMLWLVARFAEGGGGPGEVEAAVVAYSLLWAISFNLCRFAIGAVCVSRLPRRIWAGEE